MAEAKSNTSLFRVTDRIVAEHLELAAFHLFESGREHTPDLPTWDDDDQARTDCRYRIMAAHRRGIPSVNLVAVERLAMALAVADGESWACSRAINPNLPEAQRLAIAASRRQRYRHVARIAISELQNFYELGAEHEQARQTMIVNAKIQLDADRAALKAWTGSIGLPSTVSQLPKDGEQ